MADQVKAPLIRECYANFECQLADACLIDKYNFFIWEVVKAHVATSPKHPETLHYLGGGEFMVSGKIISRRVAVPAGDAVAVGRLAAPPPIRTRLARPPDSISANSAASHWHPAMSWRFALARTPTSRVFRRTVSGIPKGSTGNSIKARMREVCRP